MSLAILFQSADLLVVDKPAAWLTTPARLSDDPRPCLGRSLQKQVGAQIFPVHRLDYEVSGLTLWALHPQAHREAQNWFEHGRIDKTYQAVSRAGGALPSREWQDWKSRLVRGKKRAFEAAYGKPSHTRARVVTAEGPLLFWELQALTGRPHQLRYEMAKHGAPILGDKLYGAAEIPVLDWIALRAVELNLSRVPAGERFGLPEVCRGSDLVLPEGV